MITQEKGALIKAETDPIQATMQKANDDPTDNSYRWLSGETDPAFGGAIRDMWNPNCYGHPGKVSDAQYHCTPDDSGGVHRNSGVPNHAFALLVDGGTFNGVTVPSIGLDKAANLWWQTQQAYLTPSSDFVDMADGLGAACADLTDQDITKVSVVPEDVQPADPITAADCAAVEQAIAAVELRQEPVQCGFEPLLASGSPSLCGAGFDTTTLYKEGFEDGLTGWEKDSEIVFPGGFSTPWRADSTPPGGRTGGVARGVDDPEAGDCSSGAGDASSRDSIISPVITMPTTLTAPKLSFDHYVATEFGWDGGNVKVSLNEGAFTTVPESAFLFNPYNADMNTAAAGNTSPIAGEPGFTGTDGGTVLGSWGTSVVDLADVGVRPGDNVRVRFDFGRDGCGGNDGWYVDNVAVTDCEASGKIDTTTALKVKPKSPTFRQDFKAVIKVRATGAEVVGKVRLMADGQRIGRGRLEDGRLVIRVTRNLAPGSHKMVAKYLGTDEFARSKDTVTVIIKRRR